MTCQLPKQLSDTGSPVHVVYWTSDLSVIETTHLKQLSDTGSSVHVVYWTSDLSVIETIHLAFKFSMHTFKYGLLSPYTHLASTHVINAPRPSLFFTGLLLPCITVNTNGR